MSLRNLVKNKRRENIINSNYQIFLFGSYLKNPEGANDIDLLIVYSKEHLSIEEILNERKCLIEIITNEIHLPVDICILNSEEYEKDEMVKYIKKIELEDWHC